MRAVFWACFAQIGGVHAHPSSPIRFLDEYRIRDLLKILALSNEACLQELLHLCGRCRGSLGAPVSLFLDHWRVRGIHI